MRNMLFFTLICCLLGGLVSAQSVTPWLTRGDQSALLAQQSSVSFGGNTGNTSATITLNSGTEYQTIDGFGFTLTQASAQVIAGLNGTQKSQLLQELFGSGGLGISALRISIGASDLSNSVYSYNETSGDVAMNNFSLSGPDQTYLIPVLKDILAINPGIKILATPWTAPTWMKTNNTWIGGSLRTDRYAAYALYFVKYLEAMNAEGIQIWAITPQNEPENPFNEPSMEMTSSEQKNFINGHLGPQIAASPYSPKIIAFDHNCDNTAYPIDVLNNSSFVDGAAFHLYGGDISAMSTVRNATGKNVYFTEQYTDSGGNFNGDFSWHLRNVVLGSMNNWSKTVFEWNLAADSNNEPRTPGGCTECLPAVTIPNANSYSRNVSYYIIGQVAKFIKPGAKRVASSNNNGQLHSATFRNPDGQMVVVAYNDNGGNMTVRVKDGTKAFDYTIPGQSAATMVWTPGGGNSQTPYSGVISVPGTVEAENFDNGGQGVAYNDSDASNNGGQYRSTGVDISNASEGGFNVGWTSDGEWLEYTVNVASAGDYDFTFRVASPGTNGRLNVAFNGSNKTGTVSIPNTGGWQNWSDVTVSDVNLSAGQQVMRVNITSGGFNFNRITIDAVQSSGFAGYYNIISRSSSKGLDVAGNATNNNANVQQYEINNGGGDNQRWEFVDVGGGYYNIKVKSTSKCLSQRTYSNTNVVQQNCNGYNRQKWELIDVGGGYFSLRNRATSRRLDVSGNSTSNSANIQTWSNTNASNQQWRFEQVETGSNRLAGPQVQSEVEMQAREVELFPNPANNELTVNLPDVHDFSSATLLDATGRQLVETPVKPKMIQLEFDLKKLPAGLYFVHLNSPTQRVIKRLIKN